MATRKEKKPSILTQSEQFISANNVRAELDRLEAEAEREGREQKQKKVTRPKQIKELRTAQVSIHFTQEEKFQLDDLKNLAKRAGCPDASIEVLIHACVVERVGQLLGNTEELKRMVEEDLGRLDR